MSNERSVELLEKISSRTARVGVIGLGYVGMPLAVEFGSSGFEVVGFEVNSEKVAEVNAGRSYIQDIASETLAPLVESGKIRATEDWNRLAECDAIIICVPTPLRKTKEPDISYILAASEKIRASMRSGQVIVLESTTYPGTTDEVLLPMFEEAGFTLDHDFFLAFSPERVDPGNERYTTRNITKVVGGVTEISSEVAAALYATVVDNVHRVSSARVAETAKLLENTFRAVNIGLVNEMAQLCYQLNIDSWEVIRAAATKPFGFMAFYPGPGIGGHCVVGAETIVVRRTGDRGGRVEHAASVFVDASDAGDGVTFDEGDANVVYAPNLEALGVDMATGESTWAPVSAMMRRPYAGTLVTVTTTDNRRVTVTDEHPMLVAGRGGSLRTVLAKDLVVGDRLPIHVAGLGSVGDGDEQIVDMLRALTPERASKVRVRIVDGSWTEYRSLLRGRLEPARLDDRMRLDYVTLDEYLALEDDGILSVDHSRLRLHTGRGPSASSFPVVVRMTPGLARLVGYYLAEGCLSNEGGRVRVRWTFNRDEVEFIDDVRTLLRDELGVASSVSQSKIDHVTHIRAGSHLLGVLFGDVLKCGRRSTEMCVPAVLMTAPVEQRRELLKGLLRGDGDVYVRTSPSSYEKNGTRYTHRNASAEVGYFSSSPLLFQQAIFLMQSMGFTPTFKASKPHFQIKGRSQIEALDGWLGPKGSRLAEYVRESVRSPRSRTFHRDGLVTSVAVKSVESYVPDAPVHVYSFEVEGVHTFTTSYGIYVHNCIPLDPHYLSWKARLHGFDARFISLAEEVNSRMPQHVVNLVSEGLNRQKKAVNGSRILILGVAYKRDIDDMRESPALAIIEQLAHKGADVVYHDPFVPHMRLEGDGGEMETVSLSDEEIERADCVVVVTDHSGVDYSRVFDRAALIVDTRNVSLGVVNAETSEKVIRL